ncbi:MAG: YigZ family protein [Nitriliruptoraceae bacterium]|nr:YigZ family protein [Nitriliruptoraceae bacterium]
MDTIDRPVEAAIEVERSRFLAVLTPIDDLDDAADVVDAQRRAHPDASHHCAAMVTGLYGDRHRSSDDGEPAGTAGAPMLAVLVGAELTDVVAVVVRWFGGTKLGAGGLVRAYTDATRAGVAAARRVGRIEVVRFALHVPHRDLGRVEHLLHREVASGALGLHLDPPSHDAAGARFVLSVPGARAAALASFVASLDASLVLDAHGTGLRRVRSR